MNTKKIIVIPCIGLATEIFYKKKQKRRTWSKNWLRQRSIYSVINLLRELRTHEPDNFRNYLKMDPETFCELLTLVAPYIQKQDTVMRKSISPEERLIATLRCHWI